MSSENTAYAADGAPSLEIVRRLQRVLQHAGSQFPDFFKRPSAKTVLLMVDRVSPLAPALGVPTAADGTWLGVRPLADLCSELRAAALGTTEAGPSPERLQKLVADLESPPEAGFVYAVAALGGGIWRLKAQIKSRTAHARPNAPGGSA